MSEQKVRNLLAEGDDRIRAGEFDEALALYRKAVELVPEPFEAQPL